MTEKIRENRDGSGIVGNDREHLRELGDNHEGLHATGQVPDGYGSGGNLHHCQERHQQSLDAQETAKTLYGMDAK
jgi:hypothetical protein